MSIEVADRCLPCPIGTLCPFRVLPAEVRLQVHALFETRWYAATTTLFREGETAAGLFVVRSGLVRLLHFGADGKTAVVRMATPGTLLGLVASVTGEPYLFTAEAAEESRVELLPRRVFVRLLLEQPAFAVELLVRVSQDLADSQQRLCEATENSLPERLLRRLRELAAACGVPTPEGVLLDLRLTVQDLADSVGCSRQWASRLVGELESSGMIRRRGRRFVLSTAALADATASQLAS
jgi:CRP-like cAMP-binding protein